MFNGREKFWASIVGGVVMLWIVGAAVFTWASSASSPGSTDADYQAAANSMRAYDVPVPVPVRAQDAYVEQLRLVVPKCTESLKQLAYLFVQAANDQNRAQGRRNLTSFGMLSAYNNWTSQRVVANRCTTEVLSDEAVLADSVGS